MPVPPGSDPVRFAYWVPNVSGGLVTSTIDAEGLDRFWRNVRTHTLHAPVAHKRRGIGRHVLTGELPQPSRYS